jgi:hypothetical protein
MFIARAENVSLPAITPTSLIPLPFTSNGRGTQTVLRHSIYCCEPSFVDGLSQQTCTDFKLKVKVTNITVDWILSYFTMLPQMQNYIVSNDIRM